MASGKILTDHADGFTPYRSSPTLVYDNGSNTSDIENATYTCNKDCRIRVYRFLGADNTSSISIYINGFLQDHFFVEMTAGGTFGGTLHFKCKKGDVFRFNRINKSGQVFYGRVQLYQYDDAE